MITYNEKERVFKLDTPNTTYMIGIVDEENFVGHIYYGRRLRDADAAYLKYFLFSFSPKRDLSP